MEPLSRLIVSRLSRGWVGGQQAHFSSGPLSSAKGSSTASLILWSTPHNSSPGSSACGIFQARVGCHFLLQCMKAKSEREVAQSCPTLSDPMDCSLPGSFVHGVFQARLLEWIAIAFSDGSPLVDSIAVISIPSR